MAEEDEGLGRGGDGQPAAGEELHASRVLHVLLLSDEDTENRERESHSGHRNPNARSRFWEETTLTSWYSISMLTRMRRRAPRDAGRGEGRRRDGCQCRGESMGPGSGGGDKASWFR